MVFDRGLGPRLGPRFRGSIRPAGGGRRRANRDPQWRPSSPRRVLEWTTGRGLAALLLDPWANSGSVSSEDQKRRTSRTENGGAV
jgi:hypothetical protein